MLNIIILAVIPITTGECERSVSTLYALPEDIPQVHDGSGETGLALMNIQLQ